jgi:guanylate kinase
MLAGSSGVGKNTLITEIKKKDKKIALMTTLTTRDMRPGEKDGDVFFFLTKEEFQKKIKAGELFEHELIHGNYYGSSRVIFEEFIKKGKILMKDMGVEGCMNLTHLLKGKTETVTVFLKTKNKKVLKNRLNERGEKQIKHRLKRYPYEQAQRFKFDFIIMNKDKHQTVELLQEIIINKNDIENYVFTRPVSKLNHKKIKNLTDEYKVGFMESGAIKVSLKGDKICILSGHEKFIASIRAGVTICKLIVENKKCKQLEEVDQQEWKTYFKELQKQIEKENKEKED